MSSNNKTSKKSIRKKVTLKKTHKGLKLDTHGGIPQGKKGRGNDDASSRLDKNIQLAELQLRDAISAGKNSDDTKEWIELKSRLSAFDRFMFLLDPSDQDENIADLTEFDDDDDDDDDDDFEEDDDDDDDDSEETIEFPLKDFFSQFPIHPEEEREDIKNRLSVFEPFFFLVDETDSPSHTNETEPIIPIVKDYKILHDQKFNAMNNPESKSDSMVMEEIHTESPEPLIKKITGWNFINQRLDGEKNKTDSGTHT